MPNCILFQDVQKNYDGRQVISSFTAAFSGPSLIGLVGPSGAGKSVLLKMISGLEKPTKGQILVNSISSFTRPWFDSSILLAGYDLPASSTVERFLTKLLKSLGIRYDFSQRLGKIAEDFYLTHLLGRSLKTLSCSELDRLILAQALNSNASIILLDDPMASMDSFHRRLMQKTLRAYKNHQHSLILYATANGNELLGIADQVMVLNQGKVEQISSPIDIYRNPQNLFSAHMIGQADLNWFPCVIKKSNERFNLSLFGYDNVDLEDFAATKISAATVENDKRFIMGIRPEYICLGDREKIKFEGIVTEIDTEIATPLVGITINKDHLLRFNCPPTLLPSYGQSLTISFDPALCHFFNEKGMAVQQEIIAA
jgi:multiple sugar transport system ATP-binding protein